MKKKAERVKMIILDVDGTMTDGRIIMDNNGVESKNFNVKDGFAIVHAIEFGIKVAVITGKKSQVVEHRMRDLKITDFYQGVMNKIEKCEELMVKYNLTFDEIAYMGDDVNDISVMRRIGLKGVPQDAVSEVREIADFVSNYDGGKGAVREFIEFIMKSQGLWCKVVKKFS